MTPGARAYWLLICLILLTACGGGQAKRESTALGLDQESSPGDLYVNMAAAYFERGQLNAALEHGLRALKEDKRNADAHYVLAIIYRRLGKSSEADAHFADALRLEPRNPEFLNAHGTMLCVERDYEEALALFRQAAANPLYQTPEVALMNASDCSRRAGSLRDAERFLREALSRNASYPPALLAMAQLAYERGEHQSARDYMTRYGRVGRPTPAALLLAYRIEAKLGNRESATTLADALRRRYPDAPEVMEL
ncbi:type IV pilus biogenesis/stability protein PilW [Thiohalocapsa halophila]|uniref:Type IV pilus biogenesis/stability protein PilW n=1 Tax=Thiohalocapsa halophila TaxID=69359 RepID=A0ABS1CGI5_9GAMM|nr:type IV pilus biogenesis/stability protein PilW [Thiohalocapsa halophila]MBK1631008.1 type IV pilus biogenesis/stability protein PilW [Thiohalocapsa halophila]